MAYQVGAACYADALQAAQVSASAQAGAIVQHGGTSYLVQVSAVQADAITYALHPLGGGTPVQSVVPYTAQPCGLLGVEDGLSLGWMVAAVWLGVYALMYLARVIQHGWGSDGNA